MNLCVWSVNYPHQVHFSWCSVISPLHVSSPVSVPRGRWPGWIVGVLWSRSLLWPDVPNHRRGATFAFSLESLLNLKPQLSFLWNIFFSLLIFFSAGSWNQLPGTPAARFGKAACRDPFPKHWLFLDLSGFWLRAQLHWDPQADQHHQLLTNVSQLPVDLPGRRGTQVCAHKW